MKKLHAVNYSYGSLPDSSQNPLQVSGCRQTLHMNKTRLTMICVIIFFICSCNDKPSAPPLPAQNDSTISVNKKNVISQEFINKESQSKLTPDVVLNTLKQGNQ